MVKRLAEPAWFWPLMTAQLHKCAYCFDPIARDGVTKEHVFPRSRFYRHEDSSTFNRLLTCFRCNNEKADAPPTDDQYLMLSAINLIVGTDHQWAHAARGRPVNLTKSAKNRQRIRRAARRKFYMELAGERTA